MAASGSAKKKGKGRGGGRGGAKNGQGNTKAEKAQTGPAPTASSGALPSINRKDLVAAVAIAAFAATIAGPRLPSIFGSGSAGGSEWPVHVHRHDVDTEVISTDPRIFMLRNILTSDECDAIVKEAKKTPRTPSTTGGTGDDKEWRRSSTGWIRKDQDGAPPIVRTLLSRVSAAANVSVAMLQKGNPLHVTDYGPGGFYLPHLDSRHVEDLDKEPQMRDYAERANGYKAVGGYPYTARRFTVLCYLSDGFEGGYTVFPLARRDGRREAKRPPKGYMKAMGNPSRNGVQEHWDQVMPPLCEGKAHPPDPGAVTGSSAVLEEQGVGEATGISLPPEKGSCVLFYNHLDDDEEKYDDGSAAIGQLDHLSLHAGCPIDNGEKWIVNVWGEEAPSEAVRRKGMFEAAREKPGGKITVGAGDSVQTVNVPL